LHLSKSFLCIFIGISILYAEVDYSISIDAINGINGGIGMEWALRPMLRTGKKIMSEHEIGFRSKINPDEYEVTFEYLYKAVLHASNNWINVGPLVGIKGISYKDIYNPKSDSIPRITSTLALGIGAVTDISFFYRSFLTGEIFICASPLLNTELVEDTIHYSTQDEIEQNHIRLESLEESMERYSFPIRLSLRHDKIFAVFFVGFGIDFIITPIKFKNGSRDWNVNSDYSIYGRIGWRFLSKKRSQGRWTYRE
jgi:hypothetical protein